MGVSLMYLSIKVSTYQGNTWNPKPGIRNLRRGSDERPKAKQKGKFNRDEGDTGDKNRVNKDKRDKKNNRVRSTPWESAFFIICTHPFHPLHPC